MHGLAPRAVRQRIPTCAGSMAVADGKLTAQERARIEQAQDRRSKKIYRERHHKQTAR